jgi:hypothetical protein
MIRSRRSVFLLIRTPALGPGMRSPAPPTQPDAWAGRPCARLRERPTAERCSATHPRKMAPDGLVRDVAPNDEQHGARGCLFDRVAEAHGPKAPLMKAEGLIHDPVDADAACRWGLKRSPVDAIVVTGKHVRWRRHRPHAGASPTASGERRRAHLRDDGEPSPIRGEVGGQRVAAVGDGGDSPILPSW